MSHALDAMTPASKGHLMVTGSGVRLGIVAARGGPYGDLYVRPTPATARTEEREGRPEDD